MEKKFESEALMVCHQAAESLYKLGVMDADEMKEFDEGCLVREKKVIYKTKQYASVPLAVMPG